MTGGYGKGPDIINSCSVNVERGEIVSILGPNGAGKSTAMKAMLGLLNLKSGSVIIDGKDISKLSPQDRVKEGISFVPQTNNVFAGMTVEENLEMGAFLVNQDYTKVIDEIYNLFPILSEKRISKKLKITQCLIRSMTIFRILKMNGYAPTIKIGIHGNSNIESFKSHSWIEINGRAINNDKEVDFKKIMEISWVE